jgi:hypothetical protein
MLKKTALSLFGLAVMLICFNPPQAHAGVVVSFGCGVSASGLRSSVPVCRAACLTSLTGRILTFTRRRTFVRTGDIVRASTPPRYVPRYEHRVFVERRPYWRR